MADLLLSSEDSTDNIALYKINRVGICLHDQVFKVIPLFSEKKFKALINLEHEFQTNPTSVKSQHLSITEKNQH